MHRVSHFVLPQNTTHLSLEELAGAEASYGGVLRWLAFERAFGWVGTNQMSFDLGLEPAFFENVSAVHVFTEQMDAIFDLVMVAERINESLVLLRDLLRWDYDDVVVFKHNTRQVRTLFTSRLGQEFFSCDIIFYL
ncbi:hypothetical protein HPB48_020681 [Haemaphysalis longicornis]|uniref:Uncharacterized protein n=1 Tax=Haemaphysalis longicornis TaxID=44386 RepID=A0A9J6G4W3_HAELO|nr:hypothetical protein HPB48_020681 [Haemaphysalis longicornis]